MDDVTTPTRPPGRWLGGVTLGVLLAGAGAASVPWLFPTLSASGLAAAALLLLASGLLPTWLVARTRPRTPRGWPRAAAALAPLALAALGLARAGTGGAPIVGGAMLLAAFPVLVLERHLRRLEPRELPEAGALTRLADVLLVTLLGTGLGLLASGLDLGPIGSGARILGGIVAGLRVALAMVGLELALRALILPFLPSRPDVPPIAPGDSVLLSFLLVGVNPFTSVGRGLRERFGIDVSRAWSVAFLKRASGPLAALLVLAAWAATGLTALGPSERGVYELFGEPAEVLGPGLHLRLPWPLGRVRRSEHSVEHRILIAERGAIADEATLERRSSLPVEARSTRWEDRLWETSHGRETTFLTASDIVLDEAGRRERRGVRPYELTNADIVIHYRIGPTDAHVLDACYRVDDGHDLVRRQARRWIQRVFASSTPEHLIGADRRGLSRRMQAALQRSMDRLRSGLVVTGVHFEAIHPPLEVAPAFYEVQAAEREAEAQVSFARAAAERVAASAEVRARSSGDAARATASEILSQARQEVYHVETSAAAYGRGPAAFRLETYLATLARRRGTNRLFLVDHRLRTPSHLLDLRPAAPETPPRSPDMGD